MPVLKSVIILTGIVFLMPQFQTTSSNGITSGAAFGEEPRDRFEAFVYQEESGKTLPYRQLSPPILQAGERYPLILFLHGAGERGNDNRSQLVHVARELETPEMQQRYPAFVIAPQCPTGQQWVDTPWTLDSHTMPEQPSEPMALLLGLISQTQKTLPIDSNRIYVVGLSMGGFGTWDLLQRRPEQFAAAIPMCGGGDSDCAELIKDVPVWVAHGDADTVVKVKRSRDQVAALRAAGGQPIYTEYPGVGHNSWTPTAQNRMIWDWLFAQRKAR